MSSPFDRLERLASRASDRLNAEIATLRPMVGRPNGRPATDPTRPVALGKAIYSERTKPVAIQSGSSRQAGSNANDFRTLSVGPSSELSVDRLAYADLAAGRQGDAIEVRGRSFIIASARPDGQGRIVFLLEGGAAL